MTKRKLPPDPENANKLRAQWAKLALRRFAEETHQSLTQEMPDIVCDLLVDLAHFCDRRKLDMLKIRHYFDEILIDDHEYDEGYEAARCGDWTLSEVAAQSASWQAGYRAGQVSRAREVR